MIINADSADSAKSELKPQEKTADKIGRKIDKGEALPAAVDTSAALPAAESSIYEKKLYASRGVEDEIKPYADLFRVTPGTVATPNIPVEYLNVAGKEISINGLPFSYNGIYRPYIIGTDLNVIPWEILYDIREKKDALDFTLGFPRNDVAGSDVEIAREPYGYSAARWRFYQPIGTKTRAYFTVDFKKTNSFFINSDYSGYHVTGGIKRNLLDGWLDIDGWKHRARAGLLSFDYLVDQLSRQSRGVDRAEIRYNREFGPPVKTVLTGFFQRSAQTITGYGNESKIKNDTGGGKAEITYKKAEFSAGLSSAYYNLRLYGLDRRGPSINVYDHHAQAAACLGRISADVDLAYAWSGTDGRAFLPGAQIGFELSEHYFVASSLAKSRRMADLQLLYFDDNVTNIGAGNILTSYQFIPASNLKSPVTIETSIIIGRKGSGISGQLGLALKDIKNQQRLSYSEIDSGIFMISPVNFDDRFVEFSARLGAELGPVSGEGSVTYRKWKNRFFDDGLEKGPSAMGFCRLSIDKQFFIPELFFGGSIEMQASSRRDYRSIGIGLTDGFAVFCGRLTFRYKDFTFYLNEDNFTRISYYPLWPYPGTPRAVWWGFRWKFLD